MGIQDDAEEDFAKFVRENVAPNVVPFARSAKRLPSKPATAVTITGSSNTAIVGNNNTMIVRVTRRIIKADVKPGAVHINDAQAARIQQLVQDIAARGAATHQKVYTAFNRKFTIPQYRLLPQAAFIEAEKYLVRWLARLAPKTANSDRQRHVAFIAVNQKKFGRTAAERAELMQEVVGKTSLRDCSIAELVAVRNAIAARWIRKD